MGCISLINVQSVFCRTWLAKQVFNIFLNGVDPLSDLVKTGFFGLRLQGEFIGCSERVRTINRHRHFLIVGTSGRMRRDMRQ